MKQYHDLLNDILQNGIDSSNRTGVNTKSVFGRQLRFNLAEGFPIVTTKKIKFSLVVAELLWFLEGSTDERRLAELTYGKHRSELVGKTTIWTANADKQGKELGYRNDEYYKDLGPVYGQQWRNFNSQFPVEFDQIKDILFDLKGNPTSRRIILSAWNPLEIQKMSLPPCHVMVNFRVNNGKLSTMLTQRSADVFLGSPFNIASYALLTHLFANECSLEVGDFVYSIADAHIYENHIDQVKEQLSRTPYKLPNLLISEEFSSKFGGYVRNKRFPIDSVKYFELENYTHHPAILAPMAV